MVKGNSFFKETCLFLSVIESETVSPSRPPATQNTVAFSRACFPPHCRPAFVRDKKAAEPADTC